MSQVELPGWYVEDDVPQVAPLSKIEADEQRRARRSRRARVRRWAAIVFVAITGVAAAVNISSLSVPGMVFLPWMVTTPFLLLVAVVCIVDLLLVLVRRTAEPPPPFPFRLVWIAAMAVLVVLATFTPMAVRARFEFSRGAFDDYAAEVLTDARRFALVDPTAPERLGSFEILDVRVVPEGLLIYDSNGAFFDDAGFAYLPDGRFPPGDGSFENPQFRSLGGGWYSFTSSW